MISMTLNRSAVAPKIVILGCSSLAALPSEPFEHMEMPSWTNNEWDLIDLSYRLPLPFRDENARRSDG